MKQVVTGALAVLLAAGFAGRAQEPAKPLKEHDWLKQFAGEWDTEGEMLTEPGKPPVKSKGTESAKVLGGFWVVSELKGDHMGTPMTGVWTIGYDPQAKKYVGTFVCSMSDFMFKYEGAVDAAGKVLTLETSVPSPADPKKPIKMRDVVEVKDKDRRVITSAMLGDDGKWVTFMTMTATRKK